MLQPPPDGRSCGNDFVCSLQCILYRFSKHPATPHRSSPLAVAELGQPGVEALQQFKVVYMCYMCYSVTVLPAPARPGATHPPGATTWRDPARPIQNTCCIKIVQRYLLSRMRLLSFFSCFHAVSMYPFPVPRLLTRPPPPVYHFLD